MYHTFLFTASNLLRVHETFLRWRIVFNFCFLADSKVRESMPFLCLCVNRTRALSLITEFTIKTEVCLTASLINYHIQFAFFILYIA